MKLSSVFVVTVYWEYRSKGGLTRRWQRRVRWWLRLLIVAAALVGTVWSTERVTGAYEETRVFRDAPACPGGATSRPDDLCVGRESAVVESRDRSESCTVNSGGGQTCSTSYSVTLRRPEPGRTLEIGVGRDLYQKSREGDRAELRVWQGSLVGMSLRGDSSTYPPPAQRLMMLLTGVALLCVGIGLWALFSGSADPESWAAPAGWLWLVLTLPWLIDGVLLGASPLRWAVTGLLVAIGTVWTLIGLGREFRESRLASVLRRG
ncbi:hypothetical protein ACFYVL_04845 [Streptomyces sp. NPDC004111]|uniref:hypothetical protein n=1 Tax=Streptomyces sp. NPDC004111 TaxID=3364690 RepID=UPI0036B1A29F